MNTNLKTLEIEWIDSDLFIHGFNKKDVFIDLLISKDFGFSKLDETDD